MHATMVSSLMPAQGAQTGLRAALLARTRLHRLAGRPWKDATASWRYSPSSRICRRWLDDLGERFEILRNTYKPYPCGIVIHPIIDACLQLRREHAIDPATIDSVAVKASPGAMALCDRRNPRATSYRRMSACITGLRRC